MLDARELPHTQLSVYLEEFMANAIEVRGRRLDVLGFGGVDRRTLR